MQIILDEPSDMTYTSTFYFGSEKKPAKLVYDSTVEWTCVEETHCDTCTNKVYNYDTSSTADKSNRVSFYTKVSIISCLY